jgi:ABC-type sugar transport system ATPase subunit
LRRPTRGLVVLHGNDVTDARPADRGVGYVPQDGALFKTMTVFDQIAFPLAIRRTPRDETSSRVKEIANLLSIGQLLDRGPAGLSGGERQRVALGRALSFRPSILLLDEPLVALDEETRNQIMGLLKAVQHSTGVTVLHVTHDATEARCLGDMCVRIDQGRLNRCDVQPKPEAER